MVERPRLLPLLGGGHSGRDPMTCLYRCGNACEHPVPNSSANAYLGDVVSDGMTRRGVVRAGALGALVLGFSGTAASALATSAAAAPAAGTPVAAPGAAAVLDRVTAARSGPLTFKAIPPNKLDNLVVPNGYDSAVVMRLGDPVLPGAPELDITDQTAERQSQQFGYNNDFVGVLPLRGSDRRALLVVNHE